MNNDDLISRSALKKAIAEFHQEENERLHTPLWGSIGLNALDNIIDNAPTVEERPQGKCKNCKFRDEAQKETHNIQNPYRRL